MNDLRWVYKNFEGLSGDELYEILQLRNKVFIVEQNCPYLDMDDIDQASWHLAGWLGDELAAYARIIPPGICYSEASIGRVVTDPSHRKSGYGKLLMEIAIQKTLEHFSVTEVKIGAQLYLQSFYSSLGFRKVSDEYLEDGIPHIKMLLST